MHGKTAQWTAEEFDKFLTDKTSAFSNVEFDGQCKTTILFLALSINFGGLFPSDQYSHFYLWQEKNAIKVNFGFEWKYFFS